MTSLELINEEIELEKDYLKSKDIYGLKSKRYTEKRLQTLLQIKSELEAWYSIKSGLIYEKESKHRMSEEMRCA